MMCRLLCFYIAASTLYNVLNDKIREINTEMVMSGIPIDDLNALINMADEFHRSQARTSPLYGCISALD